MFLPMSICLTVSTLLRKVERILISICSPGNNWLDLVMIQIQGSWSPIIITACIHEFFKEFFIIRPYYRPHSWAPAGIFAGGGGGGQNSPPHVQRKPPPPPPRKKFEIQMFTLWEWDRSLDWYRYSMYNTSVKFTVVPPLSIFQGEGRGQLSCPPCPCLRAPMAALRELPLRPPVCPVRAPNSKTKKT